MHRHLVETVCASNSYYSIQALASNEHFKFFHTTCGYQMNIFRKNDRNDYTFLLFDLALNQFVKILPY